MIKPCNTTNVPATQAQTGNASGTMATSNAENEKTLKISLDSLLLGGLKQSTAKNTNCATCGRCDESKKETQPQASNTRNKKQELKKSKKASPIPAGGATTLMMRGIPCGLSADALMSLVNDAGLKGKYDFFYLPTDPKKNANLGYAFINFVNAKSAEHCTEAFTGVRLAPLRSPKTCSLAPASVQGLANLSEHFKHTMVSKSNSNGPIFLNVAGRQ